MQFKIYYKIGGVDLSTLEEIINRQIKECDEVLQTNDFFKINKLAKSLYSLHRIDVKPISTLGAGKSSNEFGENELRRIRDSLEMHLAKEMLALEKEKYRGTNLSLESKSESNNSISDVAKVSDSGNSTNTITNTVTLDLKAIFDNARKVIEDDEALCEEEVQEIISKINEIEKIGNEDTSRPQKWRKLKDCVTWTSTKGVKIAMQVMPLIMKVLEM